MLKWNMETVTVNRYRWTCVVVMAAIASAPLAIVQAQSAHLTPPTAAAHGKAHSTKRQDKKSAKKLKHASVDLRGIQHAATKHLTSVAPARGLVAKLSTTSRTSALPARSSDLKQNPDSAVVTARDPAGILITAHFGSASIRQVLSQVFDAAGVNYSIKSDVKLDTVSCSVRNMPLDTAVQTILESVRQPLTYRIEGGTYFITARDLSTKATSDHVGFGPSETPIVRTSEGGPGAPMELERIVELRAEGADVRQLLQQLFKGGSKPSYAIDPRVQGTVTLSLKNVTLETALQNVLRQVDSTYMLEGGVINIVRRSDTAKG